MNADQANTDAPASAPIMCKMGCGFFGSEATGMCCSKCFLESVKKENENVASSPAAVCSEVTVDDSSATSADDTKPAPMEVDTPEPVAPAVNTAAPATATATTTKKKKKKTSYKNLMSNMMKASESDAKKDRPIDGLGGGKFTKIEKI